MGWPDTYPEAAQFISPVAAESFQVGQDALSARRAGTGDCTRLLLLQESKGSVGSTALRSQGLLLQRCFSSAVCHLQCHLSHQQPSSKGSKPLSFFFILLPLADSRCNPSFWPGAGQTELVSSKSFLPLPPACSTEGVATAHPCDREHKHLSRPRFRCVVRDVYFFTQFHGCHLRKGITF